MSSIRPQLIQSLETGFIDLQVQSNKYYRPRLVLNDEAQGTKVLTTINHELQTCTGFWFSVAFITTSGVASIFNTLTELEERGIRGKILASQYLNFTQPEALRRLLQFSNIELRMVTSGDFHSKGYLFYHGPFLNFIIGSSNLTANALSRNKEWNLKVTAARESELIDQTLKEFEATFHEAAVVDEAFIQAYEETYAQQVRINHAGRLDLQQLTRKAIQPNAMQVEALQNIDALRKQGHRKALLISATGTGKTYLSAFDVKAFKPKRLLFVVHRLNIARKAAETFNELFGQEVRMGLYSGSIQEATKDFVFSTVQTISKEEHLTRFAPDHFDYIVIDETHRAGAESYQRLMEYFQPQFLLGMTATPERTDGLDVFKLFDYNIAYEIRLHQALKEDMLSPFHYYGVTDLTINGTVVEETTQFNLLMADERVRRIIQTIKRYGTDDGTFRGLVFCSRRDECDAMAEAFQQHGFRALALTGAASEPERADAIQRLESDNPEEKLDFIFTVDIFNEGIDIPRINQIVMLRPTQSAIIFVQQLGRGLRKTDGKDYLTVIDFIGNYNNNFLVPIALYGDTTYNKDNLRKLMAAGSELIPGTSTIQFDRIAQKRIFDAIDQANLNQKRDLVNDYRLLKYQIGRPPLMVDFLEHGARDAFAYVSYAGSFAHFQLEVEKQDATSLSANQLELLKAFAQEINNTKRIEETFLIDLLLHHNRISLSEFSSQFHEHYGYFPSPETIQSMVNNLNFQFPRKKEGGNMVPLGVAFGWTVVHFDGAHFQLHPSFQDHLLNSAFRTYLEDNVSWALKSHEKFFKEEDTIGGFQLYRKYSRKDVFRILNWDQNPVAQNVGGYIIAKDNSNCPIFVNYHKHEDISSTTRYEDAFLSQELFQWMSKSKRTLTSPDVSTILHHPSLRIPLFVKKSNDEGQDFYYMGELAPLVATATQETMRDEEKGKNVPVVKMHFDLTPAVEDHLYRYITDQS